MLPPPTSDLITEAELTAEIKAIYAGVVVVEAKCKDVDEAEANDPSPDFDQERWQALIVLHQTLLYEHHDFLMATQHPSATPALRALPTQYSMPARMWKHAIHGVLEVLRHRRPELQDYMVSFIYLAYSMVTLLYETVTAYLDIWIECLGDLARYRMAIEQDREEHAHWASVAASWYTKASDRHPQIGRLYHHLAILERPSLRKIACYGKSLTCVIPFLNARESLNTLCKPIAEEAQPARQIALQAEAAFCKLHALIFLVKSDSEIQPAFNIAFSFLHRSDAFKWRECGVPLAVANISALLGHGAPSNLLRVAFDRTIRQHVQRTRQSQADHPLQAIEPPQPPTLSATEYEESRRLVTIAKQLTLASFHTCMRCRQPGTAALRDSFAFVNVMFCFLHSVSLTKKQNGSEPGSSMALNMVFGLDEVDWGDVASFLTILTTEFSVLPHIVASAQQKVWPEGTGDSSVVLPEDWAIRGLVWAYFACCPEWFKSGEDQDQDRTTETAGMDAIRARRIQYYALRIAYVSTLPLACFTALLKCRQETGYLSYDERTRIWAARSTSRPPLTYHATPGISAGVLAQSSRPSARSTGLASPATTARSLPVSSRSGNQQQSQPVAFNMQNQATTPRWADVAASPLAVVSFP